MRVKTIFASAVCLFILTGLLTSMAVAGALTPNPALTRDGEGLNFAAEGIGLEGLGAGTANLDIVIGGPVQAAFLYWAGRVAAPCPTGGTDQCIIPFEPYQDQELIFDGNEITGDIAGFESQLDTSLSPSGQGINNIGYLADVTLIVQAKGIGPQTFTIEDGDTNNNLVRLNGAGLIVLYQDLSDPASYRVMVYDGLDFAFGRSDQIPEAQVTSPVVFNHGATGNERTAELVIFNGDATPNRPDRIEVTDAFGAMDQFVNQLIGADGASWDVFKTDVTIPANGGTTTVQLFSEPFGQFPDSLLWELGALRVPLPGEPAIDIRKQIEGPDTRTFVSGTDVTFEIEVRNTGNVDLTNVVVTDVLAPQCDNNIGNLAAGDTFTYSCTVPNVTDSFENEVCVEGDSNGTTVEDCDPSTVEIIDIDIRKQAEGPDSRIFPPGSDVPFDIVVTNTGDEDLSNVEVTDAQVPGCAQIIGDLAAGASFDYTCTAPNVTQGFVNEACVSGERNGVTVEDCDPSTVVIEEVAIDIRKEAEGPDTRTFPSGSDVTFAIVVTNTGQVDLTNVEVTDAQVPGCANFIGDLAAGDSDSYICTAPGVTASFENIACVEGEALGLPVEDCDPSTVEIIDIDIRKQEEGPDTRPFPPGSDVEFEIVVTNTGDEDLENVMVTDVLVHACDEVIGSLASGASVTYTCTAPDVTMSFVNEACVTGERNDVTVTDCDPSTVEIEGGGEGCTPGYWKQSQHFDSWVDYDRSEDYGTVFGVDASFTKTLLGALKQGGGGEKALGRHAVAALLNSSNSDVSFAFTTAEVIAIVQDAYGTGNFEGAKNRLAAENEQGCPLN